MGTRAVPRLIEALHDPNLNVRRHAALTLGKNPRAADAVPALTELLQDPEPMVREAAAEALRRRKIRNPKSEIRRKSEYVKNQIQNGRVRVSAFLI